ncbi:MAG: hypothetical protein AB8F74_10335 [Saprospiraceae bacterium]
MKPYYPRIFVTEKPLGDTKSITSQKTPIVDLVASKERRVDIQSVSVTGQCDPNPLKGNTPLTSTSPIKLRVLTFDEITGQPLSGTTVDFASITYPKESRTNMENHTYNYDISRQIIYSIVATKPGYTKAIKSYFSGDGTGANPAEVRLYLRPKTPTSGDIKMRVLTFHELTGEPLPGATVNVMSSKSTDASVSQNINDYTYLYNANWKTNYKIEGKKPGYTLSRKEVYTKPDMKLVDNTVEVKLYMRPTVDLTALTYDVNGNSALNDVKVELILLPQTRTLRTQQLADINAYDYELDFKQSYMVVASKDGYTSDTTYVSTKDIPMEPTTLQTKLYLCKFIPMPGNIPLYFDNDHPNPDTEQTTTELTYQQTFEDYLSNRNYFEKKFSKGTKGYKEMNSFFEDDVKSGMARLNDFAQELYNTLSTADEATTIEITIQGHASLRSNRSYNMALTKRRIGSLENYLRTWSIDGQSLGQYYSRLKIKEVPRGEEEACEGCYHRMSIRDIRACRDRRVDIISAKVLNNCRPKVNRPGK